jgi:peptidoglycan/xylan/chitin deacetylase (PgdA/CDA1 family)
VHALVLVIAAAAALPAPRDLPTVPRLIQGALPVYCAGTRGRSFALTFDDGPSPYTLRLVRVLRGEGARATFFEVGNRVAIWPAGVSASTRVGELGNHTWSHAHLPRLSRHDAWRELEWTQITLDRAVGRVPRLFRPPYAEAERIDDLLARQLGMLDVRWSVDGGDSRLQATPRAVIRTVLKGLRPGAIVLLHDPHPWTPDVARAVLRAARRKGLRAVTVSELLLRQPPSVHQLGSEGAAHCPR